MNALEQLSDSLARPFKWPVRNRSRRRSTAAASSGVLWSGGDLVVTAHHTIGGAATSVSDCPAARPSSQGRRA
jgi:hypothetical protein